MMPTVYLTKGLPGEPNALERYDAAIDKLNLALETFERETENLLVGQTIIPRQEQNGSKTVSRTKIDDDVLEILKNCRYEGDRLYLPPEQLDKKLYVRVNEVLERLGGKWRGGKVMAHVFDDDPKPLLSGVLESGIKPLDNPLDFYETPENIIDKMLDLVTLAMPKSFLEPSAGHGKILRRLISKFPNADAVACEIDPKKVQCLRASFAISAPEIHEKDFLEHYQKCELIVMNPPFTAKRDKFEYIAHINRAYNLLEKGGELISVAPKGLRTNKIKRVVEFRSFVLAHGRIVDLSTDSFKESGTGVSTLLVYLKKGLA